jgi:hypothetical protein
LKQRNSKSLFKSVLIPDEKNKLDFTSDSFKFNPSKDSNELKHGSDFFMSTKLSESVYKEIEDLKEKYEHNLALNTQLKVQQMKIQSQIDDKSLSVK